VKARLVLPAAALAVVVGGCAVVAAAFGVDGGDVDVSPVSCQGPAVSPGAEPAGLDAEQVGNAATIIGVVLAPARTPQFPRPALPVRAAVIAVATARQESALRNIAHGDRDSLGLFQQRPSQGWGAPDQLMDPEYATDAFLFRLQSVPAWQSRPLTEAAQAVQRSGYPAAYAQWEPLALATVAAVTGESGGGLSCEGGSGVGPAAPASEKVRVVLAAAEKQLGLPYVWGGGDAAGPTGGLDGAVPPGFDCSGLVLHAWAQVDVVLPHSSAAQYGHGTRVPVGQATPGDLIFLSSTGDPAGIHHVAMVWSEGQIVEAQTFGVPVHVRTYKGPGEPEIMPYAVRLA
jgi:peptidoglycan DL-endopeptidase CwlO